MPTNIYKRHTSNEENEFIIKLCHGEWEMPIQIDALEKWLEANNSLAPGEYVADIGYSVRKDALGGGGVFTIKMMQTLVAIGMEVYFSEYPWGDDNEDDVDTSL